LCVVASIRGKAVLQCHRHRACAGRVERKRAFCYHAYLPMIPMIPPLPSLPFPPPPVARALRTTESFPCSLPLPSLVLICSSTVTVGLTYREARTVECGNCRPRTRRGEEEVGIDDYHMLPSLPISRTSITIITFPISFFLFSFLSTRPLSPTSLFPFWAGWWCAQLVPGNSHSTGIFHAAERSMPWLAIFSHAGGGGRGKGGSVVWVE